MGEVPPPHPERLAQPHDPALGIVVDPRCPEAHDLEPQTFQGYLMLHCHLSGGGHLPACMELEPLEDLHELGGPDVQDDARVLHVEEPVDQVGEWTELTHCPTDRYGAEWHAQAPPTLPQPESSRIPRPAAPPFS